MLRVRNTAMRVHRGNILSQETRPLHAGGRIRRWRSDQSASLHLEESAVGSDDPVAPLPTLFSTRPRVRGGAKPRRRTQDEHLRTLFETLCSHSAIMPRALMKVNGESSDCHDHVARSWRDAAELKDYRTDQVWRNWGRNRSAAGSAVVEPYIEGDEHEEEEGQNDIRDSSDIRVEEISMGEKEESVKERYQNEDSALNQMEEQLMAALDRNKLELAIELFEAATVANDVDLSLKVVYVLLRRLSYNHPFHTYQLLQYVLQRTNSDIFNESRNLQEGGLDEEELSWLYHRMCFSLRALDPAVDRHGNIRALVGSVSSEVKQLSLPIQKRCIPELVTSLVMQKSAKVGQWARSFYARMSDMELELPPTYFQHLLTCSRFNREDIPYHDVLYQVVRAGLRPYPHVVIGAVENMYPYTGNIKGSYIALECVTELQSQTKRLLSEQETEIAQIQSQMEEMKRAGNRAELERLQQRLGSMRDPHSYVMDITSLECIADAAARKNFVELVLLVWDALDVMGLEASETLYETTILCFARNAQLLENCFAVLNDMEQKYTPSQPFVRAFGVALRENRDALDKADALMESARNLNPNSIQFTPSAVNALMAAHAWKGNVARSIDLLDAFRDIGSPPDEASLSYALESIGKAAKRLFDNKRLVMSQKRKDALVESFFEASESVLERLEEARDRYGNPIFPSHHFIRNYVEFLCTVGEVRTAGLVAEDFMKQDCGMGQLVDNKTLWKVAFVHAENGNFKEARKLACSTSEVLPFMDQKMDSIESVFKNALQEDSIQAGATLDL